MLNLLSFALLSIGVAEQPTDLVGQWRLIADHHKDGVFAPAVGGLSASSHGLSQFSADRPLALMFDGAAKHHLSLGSDLENEGTLKDYLPARDISVEAWVKIDKEIEWGGIIGCIQDNGSFECGWQLGYRKSKFYFALSSEKKQRLTYLQSGTEYVPGSWYHVAGTYDGKLMRVYVDGVLQGQSNAQVGPIKYAEKKRYSIGAYHDDNELHPLTGQIEQISVFKKVLSDSEILQRFNARKDLFPGIEPVPENVRGWPTYMRDNSRTGISQETLKLPLQLKWIYRARHAPRPAWPPPAKQDFWHKKTDLKPRVIYDRAFHVVTVNDDLIFGSSADDSVHCLDASTGKPRWTFYAEGPIRLAPTIAGDKVLFGSDDGCVYCLNRADGALRWRTRLGLPDQRLPGNSRTISMFPIRTSVIVQANRAHVCAGLFPSQGTYQAEIDIDTGELVAKGKLNSSTQGYLERRGGRIYSPTGRTRSMSFVSHLKRRGKTKGKETSSLEGYPFAFVGCEGLRFGGGDGKVAAFNTEDGKEEWAAEVKGRAYSMAISNQRLFVSMDRGLIYCFQSHDPNREVKHSIVECSGPAAGFPYRNSQIQKDHENAAKRILSLSPWKRGFCLIAGSGGGELAYELAWRTKMRIVCVEGDAEAVARSRTRLNDAGLYGARVTVHHLPEKGKLPYTDYMFNLVVSAALVHGEKFPGSRAEALRVLRPHGGIAILDSFRDVRKRGPLEGEGSWTHMYANPANTVCSDDTLVRGKLTVQWFGPPGPRQMLDRHHRTVAPLWNNGRLFIPGNDRFFAVDAYNGTVLWNEEIPNSRRVAAFRDSSNMVAVADKLFIAVEDNCLSLEADSGKWSSTFAVPASDGKRYKWGYLASQGDTLFGSATRFGAVRRDHSKEAIGDAYYDNRPPVCSEFLFALGRDSGQHRWTYIPPDGVVSNPTVTIGDGKMFFIESKNPRTLLGNQDLKGGKLPPRITLSDLVSNGLSLVALNARTGGLNWKRELPLRDSRHNFYIAFSQGKLVVVGSRNEKSSPKAKPTVHYDILVFDADTGALVWKATQDNRTKAGGSHGEQDHRPVIAGDFLCCEPAVYDLHSGKRREWGWKTNQRSGCGQISASSTSLFFRHRNPTMFDLKENTYSKITTSTRPGCWINLIPAGGLLLAPEASSGCTCDFAIQTSMAFRPVEPMPEGSKLESENTELK
ncbi:MAG: PQQ-binding-like beta-propeller repeat protein [Planctomycetota bacterium]|nr:PQQ-binding-like beta-propeller repeat protein [Planctomycetota bacterium]